MARPSSVFSSLTRATVCVIKVVGSGFPRDGGSSALDQAWYSEVRRKSGFPHEFMRGSGAPSRRTPVPPSGGCPPLYENVRICRWERRGCRIANAARRFTGWGCHRQGGGTGPPRFVTEGVPFDPGGGGVPDIDTLFRNACAGCRLDSAPVSAELVEGDRVQSCHGDACG